jgi:hypothetical protein
MLRGLLALLGWVALAGAPGIVAGCRNPAAHEVDAAALDPGDAPAIDAAALDPGDAAIDGPAIDGPPGVPDLQLVAGDMRRYRVTPTMIEADHCAVTEGCVSGTGMRQLLRFPTETVNRGTGDLLLPPVPDPEISDDNYEWSPCHKHHHLKGYTRYELVGREGVILTGRKQAFCIADMKQIDAGAHQQFDCASQGLTRGWADVYDWDVDCQWLDVTDVAPGTYTLRVVVNPDGMFPDSDRTNHNFTMPVAL